MAKSVLSERVGKQFACHLAWAQGPTKTAAPHSDTEADLLAGISRKRE